jgi:hypothetical protein
VGFRDLPAQDETDSRTARLCREEWDEEVGRIRKAGAIVLNEDFQVCPGSLPADASASAGLERSVDGITYQVDEQLLELIAICFDH